MNAFYVLFDVCWCDFLVYFLLLNAVCFMSLGSVCFVIIMEVKRVVIRYFKNVIEFSIEPCVYF